MARESLTSKKTRAKNIYSALFCEFPNPQCELIHSNPLELLIATILSAQCTDKKVNQVTPKLFEKYPGVADFAKAEISELEYSIKSIGLYRSKAKNIKACCEILAKKFKNVIPMSMSELTSLPGVGRKTANVVMGNAFGLNEGIVVDTHVKRIAGLLNLSKSVTPEKIELDLIKIIPKEVWTDFSHLLILHGRKTCIARRPKCRECSIAQLCPSKNN